MAQLTDGDALLIVDVQNDFCPGGALPVDDGDEVIPVVNTLIDDFRQARRPIYASRDWHPTGHVSFDIAGGPWPVHCVQDTAGAAFHSKLALASDAVVVTKGTRFDQDQNSALDETGFAVRLRTDGVRRLWVVGLALDVCVKATVLDAIRDGFAVVVVTDGCRGVDAAGSAAATAAMREAGAEIV